MLDPTMTIREEAELKFWDNGTEVADHRDAEFAIWLRPQDWKYEVAWKPDFEDAYTALIELMELQLSIYDNITDKRRQDKALLIKFAKLVAQDFCVFQAPEVTNMEGVNYHLTSTPKDVVIRLFREIDSTFSWEEILFVRSPC